MSTVRFSRWLIITLCAGLLSMAANALADGDAALSAPPASRPAEAATEPAARSKPLVVGFAQVGAESGWRTANTKSIKDEAKKRDIDLKFVDAQGKQENQITALRAFIDQRVDVIILSPVVSTGWEPVLKDIALAGIPVIISDRRINAGPELFVTYIGPDFVQEGRSAGEWLVKKTGGKANIAEIMGTPGSTPANDRHRGFMAAIKDQPDMKVIMSQTGDFQRSNGKQAMEAVLRSPQGNDINVLFAHNDDMAIGAIMAIEEAGKKPGTDIIVVSVDGVKDAFKAMAEGKLNCTVDCNPLTGPILFDTVEKITSGQKVDSHIVSIDGVYDADTTEDPLSHGF